MNLKKDKTTNLIEMKNFLDYDKKINVIDNTFSKIMFIYEMAIKEINTKIEILQKEYKVFYNYDLVDHINTRIKKPESIIQKMKNKECKLTYQEMIKNINDIAGIRIICPLTKDVFSVRNLIEKIPGVKIIKEKDYITKPKESAYSSYHMIIGVPVTLSQQIIYVKVEIQIRTMAMDFWSSIEHKVKYKSENEIDKKSSKEWINCAKMVRKLDNKMMQLN